MGYYSDYNGAFVPKNELTDEQRKSILDWFKTRFGDYTVSDDDFTVDFSPTKGKWFMGDIYFSPNTDEVLPICANMKGYDFNEHTYEFVEFLKTIGVEYEGEVERTGEEFGDMEAIRIEDGEVRSYAAHIEYDNPQTICQTEAQKYEEFQKRYEQWKKDNEKGE